jgi:cytochrome c
MQGVSPNWGERKERSWPGAQRALRAKGRDEGYSYSPANKNSGVTWDEATFREYIKDPRAKIPGTKMTFPGLKDPKQIDDIVAYLKQFDSTGKKTAGIVPAGRKLAKVQ